MERITTLDTVRDVVDFLTRSGWKASKSTVYGHWKRDGKLRAMKNGRFAVDAVLEYARSYLSRIDGAPEGTLAEEKLRAEIERIKADAQTRGLRLRQLQGELIPKSDVEFMLSERAVALVAYFGSIARTGAARVIKIVNGDPQKEKDLIAWWLAMNKKAFDNYARAMMEEEEE
ncbi:hypothetical protein [Trichloromonas sp.]|uniref:hypothetical protein n=1 Tax=Trichloromonas sp. TaxID=3069249 RepID=UPI002A437B3D|nr:hypothetical protein [Trichloromonas sp.]